MKTTEVTARFVGSVDLLSVVGGLAGLGFFAQGVDRNGSGVWRFRVENEDPAEACTLVASALLDVHTIVLHDVRPGPYEEIADTDDAEACRLAEFLEQLAPPLAAEVRGRITELGEDSRPGLGFRGGPVAERHVGSHPVTGRPIEIKNGKFGPYITDGQISISLRGGDDPVALTREEAAERLANAKGRRVGERMA